MERIKYRKNFVFSLYQVSEAKTRMILYYVRELRARLFAMAVNETKR